MTTVLFKVHHVICAFYFFPAKREERPRSLESMVSAKKRPLSSTRCVCLYEATGVVVLACQWRAGRKCTRLLVPLPLRLKGVGTPHLGRLQPLGFPAGVSRANRGAQDLAHDASHRAPPAPKTVVRAATAHQACYKVVATRQRGHRLICGERGLARTPATVSHCDSASRVTQPGNSAVATIDAASAQAVRPTGKRERYIGDRVLEARRTQHMAPDSRSPW